MDNGTCSAVKKRATLFDGIDTKEVVVSLGAVFVLCLVIVRACHFSAFQNCSRPLPVHHDILTTGAYNHGKGKTRVIREMTPAFEVDDRCLAR